MSSVRDLSRDEKIDEMLAEREIAKTIMAYGRASDRKDFAGMRATYHDDAIDNHGMFNGPIDEFIKFCRQHHERYDMFMHLLGSPNIDVKGSKAFAETYCLLIQRMKPQKTYNADVALHVMAGSRFLDRFEKRNGLWKVSERQVVVEWFRNEWSSDLAAPGPVGGGGIWKFGSRSADDPVFRMRDSLLGEGLSWKGD